MFTKYRKLPSSMQNMHRHTDTRTYRYTQTHRETHTQTQTHSCTHVHTPKKEKGKGGDEEMEDRVTRRKRTSFTTGTGYFHSLHLDKRLTQTFLKKWLPGQQNKCTTETSIREKDFVQS